MCYNISLRFSGPEKLKARYAPVLQQHKATLETELPQFYFVSGFDHPLLPVVNHNRIELNEWGLIPFWASDSKAAADLKKQTLNAVGETVFDKPAFKDCIMKQRCLVPVSGFFEWRDVNKVKYPHYIRLKSNDLFSLGGIYSSWTDRGTGEIKSTFSVLTTAANPMLEKIHNLKKRMPLIIGQDDERRWIDPALSKEEIAGLIKPYDETGMQAYAVSRHINNARNDRNIPEVLNEVKYAELNETPTLF